MILDKFTDNNVIVRLIALNQFTYHHNRDSEKKNKNKIDQHLWNFYTCTFSDQPFPDEQVGILETTRM